MPLQIIFSMRYFMDAALTYQWLKHATITVSMTLNKKVLFFLNLQHSIDATRCTADATVSTREQSATCERARYDA